ncbi:MAG TPA: YkgJ family cysteine cluster protein [Verrucomicrobiae bacterium]|nr:YkgJ family cysteine cluster protein [Verrucomicrobiae bacterium]
MPCNEASGLNALCLECGLCCNGVIFANGELRSQAEAGRAQALGLALVRRKNGSDGPIRFRQPCAALNGCACTVYPGRPKYCREFQCLLFQKTARGDVTLDKAMALTQSARKRVARITRLLALLGDTRPDLPLMARFRRVQNSAERSPMQREAAVQFSELSLEMHQLNLLLGREFYPG